MKQVNLKEKIWNEKFRPSSIQDCILPEVIKRNFENFVIAKDCPNLMLHSVCGGTGKCLHPNESLTIFFPEKVAKELNLSHFQSQITLQQLFDHFKMFNVSLNTLKSIEEEGLLIQNPFGDWQVIKGLIRKQDHRVHVTMETGLEFKCGLSHIILTSTGFNFIEIAGDIYNAITQTYEKIINKNLMDFGDVYDIALDYPHLYITPNGLTHHNTSTLKALCHDLNLEYLFINASEQRSIDILRNEVTQFVSTISLEGRNKAVLFDEFCLEENEEIQIGTSPDNVSLKSLKELEKGVIYPIISLNLETLERELDYGEIISEREELVFEVELEDGRKIQVTKEHPFFKQENNTLIEQSIIQGLQINDQILSVIDHYLFTKIKSITPVGVKKVRNLVVYKNHNFITKNGIVTHNCNSQPITQNALRGFIEQYSQVRFFFSCNHLDKIIQPLQSRCTVISFDWKKEDQKYLKNKFYNRTKQILDHEQIEFKKEVVVELINQHFPDFRRIINELQKYSISGIIDEGLLTYSAELNLGELFKYIKDKNFTEVRKFVETNDTMNYELFFKNFYQELKDLIDPKCLPNCILILGNYMFRHSTVLDKQINLLCCLIEIMAEIKFK